MVKINAQVEYTRLGVEDHGVMTFMIGLKFPTGGQGYGGFALDSYNKETEQREGWGAGITAIRKILETLKVDNWEDLKGTLCRIQRRSEHDNDILAIGHILEDKWFDLYSFAKENSGD